jgi:hypothetical protein
VLPTLSIVELCVRHWAAAVAWFREHFQLETVLNHPAEEYALLQAGPVQLAIKGDANAVVSSTILLQWQVPNVEAWQSTATVLQPLKTSHEGYRRIIIEGPEGLPLLLYDFAGLSSPNGDNALAPRNTPGDS